jgi:hypothetical protein
MRVLSPALFEDFVTAYICPACLSVRGIAPATAKVTARKPDKKARHSLVFPFSLKAFKNLGNFHSAISA